MCMNCAYCIVFSGAMVHLTSLPEAISATFVHRQLRFHVIDPILRRRLHIPVEHLGCFLERRDERLVERWILVVELGGGPGHGEAVRPPNTSVELSTVWMPVFSSCWY